MKKIYNRRRIILLFLFTLFLICLFSIIRLFPNRMVPNQINFPILKLTTKEEAQLLSNDSFLLKTIKKYGPAQVMDKINMLSTQRNFNCHLEAHKVGRVTYGVFGSSAFELCSSLCHSGCFHGSIEAFFRDKGTANLQMNLQLLCANEKNGFFTHQCLHGVGHGLMAWSDYQLFVALRSCDVLDTDAHRASCWSGVFMENVVGALAKNEVNSGQKSVNRVTDPNLHYTSFLNDDPQFPCNIVEEKYRDGCYFLQPTRMLQLFNYDFERVANECLKAPVVNQRSCFQSLGREVDGSSNNDVIVAIQKCQYAPYGDARTNCLIGAVQDTFWDPSGQKEALSFCEKLTDNAEVKACYDTIIERAGQVLDNKALNTFCNKVPVSSQVSCNPSKS